MQKNTRRAQIALALSLLVLVPITALAVSTQEDGPLGTRIFNRIIDRLCAAQRARHTILIDPSKCPTSPPPPSPEPAQLTVIKIVVNDNGGTATSSDFLIHVHQVMGENMVDVPGSPQPGAFEGTTYNNLSSGTYHVAEAGTSTYTMSFSGACDSNGTVVLAAGESKMCTITNDDVAPPHVEGKLLITEVLYDLGTGQGSEPGNEWVEIRNGTDSAVNLAGYFIHDATGQDSLPSVILPAGKFAVITGATSTPTLWSIPGDAVLIVLANPTIGGGLGNTSDRVWLANPASSTVDAVSWGEDTSAFSPAAPDVAAGHSLARNPVNTDTDTAADWIDRATPTPGS